MSRLKNIFKILLVFLLLTLNLNIVKASNQGKANINLVMKKYNLPQDFYDNLDDDYLEEEANIVLDSKGGIVEPGDIIQLNFEVERNSDLIVGLGYEFEYDKTQLEVLSDASGSHIHYPYESLENDEIFPKRNNRNSHWNEFASNVRVRGGKEFIAIINSGVIGGADTEKAMIGDGNTISLFFKVKEDLEPGTIINFELDESYTSYSAITGSNTSSFVFNNNSKGYYLAIAGEQTEVSNDLDSVTISGEYTDSSGSKKSHDYLDNFNKETESYDFVVPNSVESLNFNAVKEDEDSEINVEHGKHVSETDSTTSETGDNLSLDVGDNFFRTVVTDGDGKEVMTYKYKVRRLSNSNEIIGITATDDNGVTNKDPLNNTFKVSGNAQDLTFIIDTGGTDKTEIISPNFKNGKLDVSGIDQSFNIKVSPEEGASEFENIVGINPKDSKTYEYHVEKLSNDTSFSSVQLKSEEDTYTDSSYDAGTKTYTFNGIKDDVTSLKATLVTSHNEAKIEPLSGLDLEDIELNSSQTEFKVRVTAEDGTKDIYTFVINRSAKSNKDLESVQVTVKESGKPKIDKEFTDTSVMNVVLPFSKDYTVDLLGKVVSGEGSSVSSGNGEHKLVINNDKLHNNQYVYDLPIVVKAEDGTTKTYNVTIKIDKNKDSQVDKDVDVKDSNNSLTGPIISSETDENGNIDVFEYTIKVPYEKTKFSINDLEFEVPYGANVQSDPELILNVGIDNKYTILLTSEDGSTRSKYIFNIERDKNGMIEIGAVNVSSNPQGILAGSGYTYTYQADSAVEKYVVSVEGLNGTKVNPEDVGEFTLNSQKHTHSVRVESQNGKDKKTLEIAITRAQHTDAKLSELIIIDSKGDSNDYINDISGSSNYKVVLDKDAEWVKFDPKASHNGSNVEINSIDDFDTEFGLQYGDNKFTVKVTAENGSTKIYSFTVVRSKNDNANLNLIKYKLAGEYEYLDGWDSSNIDYSISEKADENLSNLALEIEKNDPNATISITNNGVNVIGATIGSGTQTAEVTVPINYGDNEIKVVVTAHDGVTQKTYTINIEKELSSSTELGDGGIKNENNDFQNINKVKEFEYSVYVPYGTTHYEESDFSVDLAPNSTIVYSHNGVTYPTRIELNSSNYPAGQYKFVVIAPNGIDYSEYTINVYLSEATVPKLEGLFINNKKAADFDKDKDLNHVQEFDLDDYYDGEFTEFIFMPYAKDGILVNFTQGYIDVKGQEQITQTVHLTDTENNETNRYEFLFKRTLSTNNLLEDILVNGNSLDGFKEDNSNYEIEVGADISEIDVEGITQSGNANLIGDGSISLNPGKNEIIITVSPEDGSSDSKNYTITVIRNLELEVLKLGDIDVLKEISTFDDETNTLTYEISNDLDTDLTQAYLEASAKGSGVTFSKPANDEVTLDNSDITFIATAYDNETKLNVVIKYNRSLNSNPSLSFLQVGNQVVTLKENEFEYDVEVDYSFETLEPDSDLIFTPKHKNTVVTPDPLLELSQASVNAYNIKVIAEDGNEETYLINITRGTYNFLETLGIKDNKGHFEEVFEKDLLEYNALIYSSNLEDTFDIEYTANDGIVVTSDEPLTNIKVGELEKTFTIKVQQGNLGSIREYVVHVRAGGSARLRNLAPSIGSIDFKPEQNYYEVNVPVDTTTVSLMNIEVEDTRSALAGSYTDVDFTGDEITLEVVVTNDVAGLVERYRIKYIKTEDQTSIGKITATEGNKFWEGVKNDDGNFEITVDFETDIDDLNFDVILEAPHAKDKIEVGTGVDQGDGTYKYVVTVTDEMDITKNYEVIVHRGESENSYLEYILVNDYDFGFNPYKSTYNIKLAYDDDFVIKTKPVHDTSVVTIGGISTLVGNEYVADHSQIKDNESILIMVTPQKGDIRTYTLNVTRDKVNLALTDLSLKEATIRPGFDKLISNYYVSVPNELEEVTVEYQVTSGHVTINGGTDQVVSLDEGLNVISVKIDDGIDTFEYYIHVDRVQAANNYLDSLVVTDLDGVVYENMKPSFSQEELNYTVKVPIETTEVNVDATADGLTVLGSGKVSLLDEETHHFVTVIENGIKRIYTVKIVKEASKEAFLEELTIDGGTLSPDFSSENQIYEIDTDLDSITINASPNDKASVKGDGKIDLVPGENVITVIVTAEDGVTTKEYTIKVNRKVKLTSVNIGGKDYTVTETESNVYKLDSNIDAEVTSSLVKPEFTDNFVNYTGLENNLNFALQGSFSFDITTRDNKSHNLVVNYERDKSSDADLESLFINGQEVTLTDGVYEYDVKVPFNFEDLIKKDHLELETIHKNTQVSSDATFEIKEGENNVYIITTTAEDGTEKEYKINITRDEYTEGPSTLLESLSTSDGKLDFVSTNFYYKVKLSKDITEVTLSDIKAVDPNALVTSNKPINGGTLSVDLIESETVEVLVTNGDQVSIYKVVFEYVDNMASLDEVIVTDGDNTWKGTPNEEGKIEITIDHDTNINDLEVIPRPEFDGGKTEVTGPVENSNGDLEYKVTITDENGQMEEYEVVVKVDKSNNAYLETLTVFGKEIVGFNKHTNDYIYAAGIDQEVSLSDIEAIAEDHTNGAKVEVTKIDDENFEITVTAANGKTNIYTIKVEQQQENKAILESLGLLETGISPRFNRNELRYYAVVPNNLSKVTVTHTTKEGAEVTINSDTNNVKGNEVLDLEVGTNTIEVVVSDEEASYTYTIYVERSKASEENVLNSLVVEDMIDEEITYDLTPSFDKDTLVYGVEVPHDVNSFNIKGDYDANLTASGFGSLIVPSFPYVHTIRVADEEGIVREYAITFTQSYSNETHLGGISVSEGSLDPVFKKDILTYHVDVDYEIDEIDIDYVKGSDDQEVIGAGIKTLEVGRNKYELVVRSGNAKTVYTVFVNRANEIVKPKLDNLWVNEGELSPTFDQDTYLYNVKVDKDVETIEIFADSDATINGIGTQTLEPGNNIFEIIVGEGNNQTSYYVVVEREIEEKDDSDETETPEIDTNLDLAYLAIIDETLNEDFDRKVYEYTAELGKPYYEELGIIAIPQNPNAHVEISGHTDLVDGEHTIEITVSLGEESQTTTITVTIEDHVLQSDIHAIGEKYITTIHELQTVKDIKDQMINDNAYLQIFKDGEALADDEIVGTGAVIKLVVRNKEYDSKILIILGDVNGDGEVSIPDKMLAQSGVLGDEGTLTELQFMAADVTQDEDLAINDLMLIQYHILELENIFEMEEDTNE